MESDNLGAFFGPNLTKDAETSSNNGHRNVYIFFVKFKIRLTLVTYRSCSSILVFSVPPPWKYVRFERVIPPNNRFI